MFYQRGKRTKQTTLCPSNSDWWFCDHVEPVPDPVAVTEVYSLSLCVCGGGLAYYRATPIWYLLL